MIDLFLLFCLRINRFHALAQQHGHRFNVTLAVIFLHKADSAAALVRGINVATCHVKPKKQGEEGGIIRREIPMYASKVMRVCPKCGKATREAFKVENGAKVRVCKKCGETI